MLAYSKSRELKEVSEENLSFTWISVYYVIHAYVCRSKLLRKSTSRKIWVSFSSDDQKFGGVHHNWHCDEALEHSVLLNNKNDSHVLQILVKMVNVFTWNLHILNVLLLRNFTTNKSFGTSLDAKLKPTHLEYVTRICDKLIKIRSRLYLIE